MTPGKDFFSSKHHEQQVFLRVITLDGDVSSTRVLTGVSDKTGKSEIQVFLYRASLRSVAHQHFRFLIKDGNNEAADKMETAYELSTVLHCFT